MEFFNKSFPFIYKSKNFNINKFNILKNFMHFEKIDPILIIFILSLSTILKNLNLFTVLCIYKTLASFF